MYTFNALRAHKLNLRFDLELKIKKIANLKSTEMEKRDLKRFKSINYATLKINGKSFGTN